MTPKVSIVTPNYNHGALIERAIQSVAKQTVPPYEHVVIDDGSSDNSVEIVRGLAEKYSLLRLFVSERNQGAAAAIARGIREARGEYIIFLSADDALAPQAVASFCEVLQQDPHAALICGDVEFGNISGTIRWQRRFMDVDKPVHLTPEELVGLQRKMIYVVNGAGALVRRAEILDVGIDDAELRWHVDLICLNAIAYRHGVWYVPRTLHHFNVTGSNYSGGASVWSKQRPVLDRVFAVFSAPSYRDIRDKFRRSAVLATTPHILQYVARHPQARDFLTMPLALNATAIALYRRCRSLIPQSALDLFVRLRGRS